MSGPIIQQDSEKYIYTKKEPYLTIYAQAKIYKLITNLSYTNDKYNKRMDEVKASNGTLFQLK